MNVRPLVLVFDQTLANEVDAVLGAVLKDFLFELWVFAEDSGVEAQACLASEAEGSRTCQHLVSKDTKSKDVSLLSNQGYIHWVRLGQSFVARLLHDLGCHVLGRPSEAIKSTF